MITPIEGRRCVSFATDPERPGHQIRSEASVPRDPAQYRAHQAQPRPAKAEHAERADPQPRAKGQGETDADETRFFITSVANMEIHRRSLGRRLRPRDSGERHEEHTAAEELSQRAVLVALRLNGADVERRGCLMPVASAAKRLNLSVTHGTQGRDALRGRCGAPAALSAASRY